MDNKPVQSQTASETSSETTTPSTTTPAETTTPSGTPLVPIVDFLSANIDRLSSLTLTDVSSEMIKVMEVMGGQPLTEDDQEIFKKAQELASAYTDSSNSTASDMFKHVFEKLTSEEQRQAHPEIGNKYMKLFEVVDNSLRNRMDVQDFIRNISGAIGVSQNDILERTKQSLSSLQSYCAGRGVDLGDVVEYASKLSVPPVGDETIPSGTEGTE